LSLLGVAYVGIGGTDVANTLLESWQNLSNFAAVFCANVKEKEWGAKTLDKVAKNKSEKGKITDGRMGDGKGQRA
jgi:hypothetical protein